MTESQLCQGGRSRDQQAKELDAKLTLGVLEVTQQRVPMEQAKEQVLGDMEAAGSAPKTLMMYRQVWEAFIASAYARGVKTLQAIDVTTFHGYRNDRQASQPELAPYTAYNQDI